MKTITTTVSTIIVLSLLTSLVSAQQQTDTGDSKATDTVTADKEGTATEAKTTVEQYLRNITELEKDHGPYDAQVGEQLYALGQLYRGQKNYEEASEVITRALHIKRVNEGVESMSQAPILNSLILTNNAAGQWEQLNQNLNLLLLVHRNNLQPGDPELLRVINIAGQWKLQAYTWNLLPGARGNILDDVIAIYESHVDSIERAYGATDPRAIASLNGLASARYHRVQEVHNTPLDEFNGVGNRTNIRQVCVPMVMADGRVQQMCENREEPNPNYYVSKQKAKNTEVINAMGQVKLPLEKIVDIYAANPGLKAYPHALALINLGDWFLLNDKRGQALDAYGKAYELLESPQLELLFGDPRRIPSLLIAPATNMEEEWAGRDYVKLSFDVSADGKAKRVKVVEESDPDNRLARKLAKEHIQTSLFRPRFAAGEPTATKEATIYLSGHLLRRN